jgi:hypothetical protein
MDLSGIRHTASYYLSILDVAQGNIDGGRELDAPGHVLLVSAHPYRFMV